MELNWENRNWAVKAYFPMVKIQPKEIPLVVLLLTDKIFLWWQYQEMVLLEYAYEEPIQLDPIQ